MSNTPKNNGHVPPKNNGQVPPKTNAHVPSNPMTKTDAARIQGNEARQNGGKVQSGGFASRAQSAAEKNSKK